MPYSWDINKEIDMAATFLATDPAGKTHKRTSQNRTYAATVVVREGTANAERKFEAGEGWRRDHDAKNFAYAAARTTAEAVTADLLRRNHKVLADDADYVARRVAENVAFVEGFATVEEYVEKQAAKRRAKFEAEKAAGSYERWLNAGWCGRPDLALKLASQQKGYDEVRILPVVVK